MSILEMQSAMKPLLERLGKDELFKLMNDVLSRKWRGSHGSWEEFLKAHYPKYAHLYPFPSAWSPDTSVSFLTTLDKTEDLQLLTAWLKSYNRFLRHHFSTMFEKEMVEQRLVRITIARHEHPLEYYLRDNPEDWLVTKINDKKPIFQKQADLISISCDMVVCLDGTEAPVRVVAIDRDYKVILNEFVDLNQPIYDLRTEITGLTCQMLDDATFLSLTDVQARLARLVSTGTIMVGHGLDKLLAALKTDHARVVDTSQVFTYDDFSFVPTLDDLCKCVLGYDMPRPSNSCLVCAKVAMKLVRCVIEKGANTSISKEMLMDASESPRKKLKKGSSADDGRRRLKIVYESCLY